MQANSLEELKEKLPQFEKKIKELEKNYIYEPKSILS